MLAALSLKLESHAFQLALCHLFFNFFGIILFFIIPKMRWPLFIARKFGEKAVKYKWFSIFYIVSSFFFLPLMIYGKIKGFATGVDIKQSMFIVPWTQSIFP